MSDQNYYESQIDQQSTRLGFEMCDHLALSFVSNFVQIEDVNGEHKDFVAHSSYILSEVLERLPDGAGVDAVWVALNKHCVNSFDGFELDALENGRDEALLNDNIEDAALLDEIIAGLTLAQVTANREAKP